MLRFNHITKVRAPFGLVLLLFLSFSACNLEKDVEVDLPEYEPQAVVQCYLEYGKPAYMLLTSSSSYFDSLEFGSTGIDALEPIMGASGTISRSVGLPDTILPVPTGIFATPQGFIYNYFAAGVDPFTLNTEYYLELDVPGFGKIEGTASIPEPVAIDTMEALFNDEGKAIVLTRFSENGSTKDFYRFTLDKYRNGTRDNLFTLEFNDEVFNGDGVTINTLYEWEDGDTAIAALYHIEESWYDFIQSSEDAASANFNPFGQPSAIKSNVSGGIGVFTGYSVYRDTLLVSQ